MDDVTEEQVRKIDDLVREEFERGDWVTVEQECGGGGGGSEPPRIDPIIQGLLSRLPKSGEVWPEPERKLWLDLLAVSFKLIYKDAPNDRGLLK